MIAIKHKNETIVVNSRYDSGVHLGFTVCSTEDDSFQSQTLDELLSDKEIKSLEMIIASVVKGYLGEK